MNIVNRIFESITGLYDGFNKENLNSHPLENLLGASPLKTEQMSAKIFDASQQSDPVPSRKIKSASRRIKVKQEEKRNQEPQKKRGFEEIASAETGADVEIPPIGIKKRLIDQSEQKEAFPAVDITDQAHFFTFLEPQQWHPVERTSAGLIKFSLPKELRTIKRLIYIFRNKAKECYLIGKTGGSLNQRMSSYASVFNAPHSDEMAKKEGRKSFLRDMKAHPEHFEIGILYELKPEEDLDELEILFIDYKGMLLDLYNDHRGGGGGLAHDEEEPAPYAVPKKGIQLFTPEKYYPYAKDEEGRIRPQLTPGFWERMSNYRSQMQETQEFAYSVKKLDTEERYIGVSAAPDRRSREHGYAAEYFDTESEKYDPSRTDGFLHPSMASDPEQFAFGILPLKSVEKIEPGELDDYVQLPTIGKVEQYLIEQKQTLFGQQGFNANGGGGGPIARSAKKKLFLKA